jgi:hypothetical protein
MKTFTVSEAQGQLPQLLAEAFHGETIVLKDGDRAVTLCPGNLLDLSDDSPELEAELLKVAKGPFTPYSSAEMKAIGEQIIREHRDAKSKQ